MKTRMIEMYIGYGSDFGTWETDYVDIPLDTPDDKIEEVAKDVIIEDRKDIAFTGVYAIPSLEDQP